MVKSHICPNKSTVECRSQLEEFEKLGMIFAAGVEGADELTTLPWRLHAFENVVTESVGRLCNADM